MTGQVGLTSAQWRPGGAPAGCGCGPRAAKLSSGGALDPAVSWHAVDDHNATADVRIGDVVHHVTIEVDERGAVCSLWLPGVATRADHPFGGELGGEVTYDGYTIPNTLRAGWGYGTDAWPNGIFFRATIDVARYG